MIKVIGIYGKARSGKTTARKYLENKYHVTPMSFATDLKEAVHNLFGVPIQELYSDSKSDRTRWILQFFGTECCRTIDPDIWVNKLNEQILMLNNDVDNIIVIDDVRFINEAGILKNKWDATLVKLVGPEDLVTNDEHKSHISETQMDSVMDSEYDAVYLNTGTLEDLYAFMDTVYAIAKSTP